MVQVRIMVASFTEFATLVGDITAGTPEDTEAAYGKLMATEQNTLRVVERVADDARQDAVRQANAWETSVSGLSAAFVKFWGSVYVSVMEGDMDVAKARLASPDGYFYTGGLLLVLALVFLIVVSS